MNRTLQKSLEQNPIFFTAAGGGMLQSVITVAGGNASGEDVSQSFAGTMQHKQKCKAILRSISVVILHARGMAYKNWI